MTLLLLLLLLAACIGGLYVSGIWLGQEDREREVQTNGDLQDGSD